jgi:hypothetical protein
MGILRSVAALSDTSPSPPEPATSICPWAPPEPARVVVFGLDECPFLPPLPPLLDWPETVVVVAPFAPNRPAPPNWPPEPCPGWDEVGGSVVAVLPLPLDPLVGLVVEGDGLEVAVVVDGEVTGTDVVTGTVVAVVVVLVG